MPKLGRFATLLAKAGLERKQRELCADRSWACVSKEILQFLRLAQPQEPDCRS